MLRLPLFSLSDSVPGSLSALLCFVRSNGLPMLSVGYFFSLSREVVPVVGFDPELPGLLDVLLVLVEVNLCRC